MANSRRIDFNGDFDPADRFEFLNDLRQPEGGAGANVVHLVYSASFNQRGVSAHDVANVGKISSTSIFPQMSFAGREPASISTNCFAMDESTN